MGKDSKAEFLAQIARRKELMETSQKRMEHSTHDVSPIVNSAKYDGPECIRPVSDDDIPRAGQLSLL